MKFKNPFKRHQPIQRIQRVPAKPKKGRCRIRIKRTENGEEYEFSPECTEAQIKFAKENRLKDGVE